MKEEGSGNHATATSTATRAIKPFSDEVIEALDYILSPELSSVAPEGFELPPPSSDDDGGQINYRVKRARERDVPALMGLIHGLAEYEKEPESVLMTDDILRRDGFGPEPLFYALLVEKEVVKVGAKKGVQIEVVGAAFIVFMYSTWEGRVIYLEDLFIYQPYRRFGIGSHLFYLLAKLCVKIDCSRFEWKALDWNTPAINFYTQKLGAPLLDPAWRTLRLDRKGIGRLAAF